MQRKKCDRPLVLVRDPFSVFAVICFRLLRCVGQNFVVRIEVFAMASRSKKMLEALGIIMKGKMIIYLVYVVRCL